MREIKFRGKRIDNGDWWHGDLITECGVDLNITRAYIHNRLSPISFNGDCMGSTVILIEVIPETISQFTGLTDKNGVEIYEGDLVKDELTRASVVEFRTGAFCIEGETLDNHFGYLWSNGYNNVEIVGNIHEVTK